jgi:hypothetical protein
VSEAIKQVRNKEPRKDIYSVERIGQPIEDKRDFVLVLDPSKVEKLNTVGTANPDVDVNPRGPVGRDAHDESADDLELLRLLSEANLAPTAHPKGRVPCNTSADPSSSSSNEPIHNSVIEHGRESVFVLPDSLQVEGAHTVSVANSDANRSVSESSGHDCHDGPPNNYLSVAIPKDVKSGDRARECRLEWLFEAAEKDNVAARTQAVDYIRRTNPELGNDCR